MTGMSKTASDYLSHASLQKHRPTAQTGTERAISLLGTAIVLTSFFFVVFPMVDLAASRWFARGSVFVLAEQPFLKGVRNVSRGSVYYIIGAMMLLLGLNLALPRRYRFCQLHKPLFVLLSFAAGPVIIVETLKALIGRARPRHLLEFGGSADFTPVWQFAATCARNCSFPSGEASGAAAALSLLVFIPERLRSIAALILTPFLAVVAFNRVLFGAHFLSDVMLGWLLTLFAMVLIWRWLLPQQQRIDTFLTRARVAPARRR
jgi:membrane-associated phospholipid phosphatase